MKQQQQVNDWLLLSRSIDLLLLLVLGSYLQHGETMK